MKPLAVIILAQGAIHLLAFAKAFGLIDLPHLRVAPSQPVGLLWLVAGALFVLAAVLSFWSASRASPVQAMPLWLVVMGAALVLSQVLIILAWQGAKAGTILNVVLLVPLVVELLDFRASSFRATHLREVSDSSSNVAPAAAAAGDVVVVTDSDLDGLPVPAHVTMKERVVRSSVI